MKEGTESKVKFKKLKRRLGMPEWQVIGLLEAIWKLARTSAQAGDIGKFSNEDIAASIEYDDDADELVRHLSECGWLDEDEEYRLIIHNWSAHVPTYLKGNFKSHGKQFADQVAKQRAKQVAKQPTKHVANSEGLPSLVKSSLAKSKEKKEPSAEETEQPSPELQLDKPPPLQSLAVEKAWDHWLKVIYASGNRINEPALFVTRGKLLDYSESEALAYLTHWAAQRRYTEDFRGKGHLVHMPASKPPKPKQTGPPPPTREYGPRKKNYGRKKQLADKVNDG